LARNIAAVAVVAALLAAATAGAQAVTGGSDAQDSQGEKYNFRVFPRVGTPTTTFRVSFTAPFRADGVETNYTLEGVGPRGCPDLFEFTTEPIRRGQRVVMNLTAFNDVLLANRRRWCGGSYVGYVYYVTPGFQPNKFIGYFSFGVGRFPVSLAP
jgi:hypothetical protein